jgi:hypothetical protein
MPRSSCAAVGCVNTDGACNFDLRGQAWRDITAGGVEFGNRITITQDPNSGLTYSYANIPSATDPGLVVNGAFTAHNMITYLRDGVSQTGTVNANRTVITWPGNGSWVRP